MTRTQIIRLALAGQGGEELEHCLTCLQWLTCRTPEYSHTGIRLFLLSQAMLMWIASCFAKPQLSAGRTVAVDLCVGCFYHTSRHHGPFTGCTVVYIFVATLGILLNALVRPMSMASLAAARQMWCAARTAQQLHVQQSQTTLMLITVAEQRFRAHLQRKHVERHRNRLVLKRPK